MKVKDNNQGLVVDELFVAATRPSTRWGVPFIAILLNTVLTMEIFLCIKNPLIFLLALPIHGVCMLLCARDIRFFELASLWAQTRLPGILANRRAWGGNSHSPLSLDFPTRSGRRRAEPVLYI